GGGGGGGGNVSNNPADTGIDPGSIPAPSSGASAAIAYARAQVGKPYEWGADGPGSFDCSGLTMRAWEQGGVSLPHYSVAQYERAAKVPISDLRSGDLVFFASDPADYRSIYHVGLYIGGGQMVEAPYTGESVRISSIWRASLVGAARP
ncbi:MAG: C40 family peptidase, partial [Sporichthyaceae bacterium]|nr:C40 family peptidase [Sporichthyaceae bacterium]